MIRGGTEPREGMTVADGVAILTRWVVGGCFLYMGGQKALHPVEFLKLIRQYDVFAGPPWLNAVAALLPWLELVCGALLVAGIAVRGAAALLAAMLVLFTWLVLRHAWLLAQSRGVPLCEVKFDCGCGAGEVLACAKLVENLFLFGFSFWLCLRRTGRFCVWHRFGRRVPG